MNSELQYITNQLKDAYEGEPWFGRNVKNIVSEITPSAAMEKPNGKEHSILELVYHMIIWREFIITRLEPDAAKALDYFEQNDWRQLDHSDNSLWQKGLNELDATQQKLLKLLEDIDENILDKKVEERKYNFRFLLYGIIQHDIYHLGQIAYVKKLFMV
ncbi:MAG: DinB family protein [Bacteroidota bacterium]|nr:DinB family protein [Bacteroidota bacterium]